MASSSAVSPASFDSLPDELALTILKMAALTEYDDEGRYDFDLLVDVISKVSTRFKRLVTDYSFWQGIVFIFGPADRRKHHSEPCTFRKVEYVVQKCLNPGTREFLLCSEDNDDVYDLLTCPRYAEFINPAKRFPNLKLVRPVDYDCLQWRWSDDSSQASDEKESSQ